MPRVWFTGLGIAILIGGILELARGDTGLGIIAVAVALVAALLAGAKGEPRSHEQRAADETKAAKTSAISRWRSRS
jgi:membrane protein implicated in regulation of membrane protease activity